MENILAVLRTSSLFEGLADDEIESILKCLKAKIKDYDKGNQVLTSGNKIEEMGVLVKGSLLIVQEDFWGNRNLITVVEAGGLFAESFGCSEGAALNVDVLAAEDSKVVWLDVYHLLTVCSSGCQYHNRIIHNLLSGIAMKNLQLTEKLMHLSQRTTREKLMSYLSAEYRKKGSSEFDIPFSRQELADYLSVERSALSTELGKLRDNGILSFKKNHFILHTH